MHLRKSEKLAYLCLIWESHSDLRDIVYLSRSLPMVLAMSQLGHICMPIVSSSRVLTTDNTRNRVSAREHWPNHFNSFFRPIDWCETQVIGGIDGLTSCCDSVNRSKDNDKEPTFLLTQNKGFIYIICTT